MSAIGRLFSPPPAPTPMMIQTPTPPPAPPPMPDIGSQVAKEAAITRMAGRKGGRSSTILGGSDSGGMGSGDYTGTKLGG
jgi:hypothetical protein